MKCDICGEPHNMSELELFFQRPDFIIKLETEDRRKNSLETDDICVYKDERFFVRGVIPLKFNESENTYCIGAWAEVDQVSFKNIYKLWDDINQNKENPFQGKLANEIPAYQDSIGINISVKLISPTKRCEIIATDVSTNLFKEQSNGISIHRAFEISSVARKRG